jgi:hypothetical protein
MKNVRDCYGETTEVYAIEIPVSDPEFASVLFKKLAKLVKKSAAEHKYVSALHGPYFADGDSTYVLDVHFAVC